MAKKVPLRPLSAEEREALSQAIGSSREPQLAKTLATLLTPSHSVTEGQVASVLEELVATGVLQKYATGKGKPKYWDRNLQELTRDAVLRAVKESAAPLTAKEVAAKIAPPKVAEADVSKILDAEVTSRRFFDFPPAKATGRSSYWHQDLRAIGRESVLTTAQQANDPFTAKELAGRLQTSVKFSEADLLPILEEAVAGRKLHSIPATSPKGKPRFWTHDVLELGCRATLHTINSKGPQTLAKLKKVLKGFSDAQFEQIIDRLRANGSLFSHPPIGTTKHEIIGTRPPFAAAYFQDIGTQLKKVVGLLKGARVPVDELRRTVVQLLEEAGISFGSGGGSSHWAESRPVGASEAIDLVGVMKRIEPGAERGALVGARELRRAVRLPKSEFDHAVLELARQGCLSLHRHDYATSLSPEERDDLVTDGEGTFYVGMALRPR